MSIRPLAFLEEARNQGQKLLAVLFDPDDDETHVVRLAELCASRSVDMVLLGGSLLTRGNTKTCLELIKKKYSGPVLLFPGNEIQVVPGADGILLLSLISGRNPDYLIGKHVAAAPMIRQAALSCLPTGYMLIDGGRITTANYISQTLPIPANKPEIAAATALAGEQLGMKLIYLDAGSGALQAVPADLIRAVSNNTGCPLFTGGGIRSEEAARTAWEAGATAVVVGNGLTDDPSLLNRLCNMKESLNEF